MLFSNPVKNLKIQEFEKVNLIAEKAQHPILKVILKLINAQVSLPSTNALTFQFPSFTVDDAFKEVKNLIKCKATQSNEIHIYILKQDDFS